MSKILYYILEIFGREKAQLAAIYLSVLFDVLTA